jgi:hypothetical protein
MQTSRQAGRHRPFSKEPDAEDIDVLRATLLLPAKHMAQLVKKIDHLLKVSETENERHKLLAYKSWPVRLLYSIVKDAGQLAASYEQFQREESLRKHADRLSNHAATAALLESCMRALIEATAERDAALAALERANISSFTSRSGRHLDA